MRDYEPYEGELPDGMGGTYLCTRCRKLILSGELSRHNILHSAAESAIKRLHVSPGLPEEQQGWTIASIRFTDAIKQYRRPR